MWMLFYVPNPAGEPQPFASMEHHLNPSVLSQVSLWRQLANQSHWHLTLLGASNEVADFFEFENSYGLAEALDTMEEACRDLRVSDFMLAKIPKGRFVLVEELAAMAAWLASEDCSFSTGAVFDISGGRATY